ncbi:MAG: protein kinase [Myxococcales bacterium]|nr:protein kinase [Myxococcales bacterium]
MLRRGQRMGKYRIRKRLAQGGFADVYRAHDTVEGVDVALKIPLRSHVDPRMLDAFRHEARLVTRLEHPNILPLKNADEIDGRFVIAYPLGEGALADRLGRWLPLVQVLAYGEQLLSALAHAHEHRLIHCDIKPENMILFGEGTRIRLADFGIAKVAASTITASASGTIGYMAPEQALGRPSARSDVFSAGLVIYRMATGVLPQWPFDWPPPGYDRLTRYGPEFCEVLQRALQVDARRRYRDAGQMLSAYRSAQRKLLRRRNTKPKEETPRKEGHSDWRAVRLRQLRRQLGQRLQLSHECLSCQQPVDERMQACPWCGTDALVPVGESTFPQQCPRCERGVKLDWSYCAWCYGPKIGPQSSRRYTDRRYALGCTSCGGKLIPFSRYCPWCRVRVRHRWALGKKGRACTRCDQPVLPEFWAYCPWCGDGLIR